MAENGLAVLPEMDAIVRRSVQEPGDGGMAGIGRDSFMLYYASTAADGITAWGSLPKKRDRELRAFWPTENYLASALATVVARNASLPWKLAGPPNSVDMAMRILKASHYGKGWAHLWSKVSVDYLTQDSGAYIQFVRMSDAPDSPVINITQLDANRCYDTGDPEEPILYVDRKNKAHKLKWWQAYKMLELPAPSENAQGPFAELQYCAVTRVLRAAQILRNIAIYKDEKTGGRFLRAIHLLSGVNRQEVQDAINEQRLAADQEGLLRHIQPLMVSAMDSTVPVSAQTIELASLPDGFDEEKTMKGYIMALALGFLTDYQEFAPLPGGGIGTGAQSETLAQKARGKGLALFKMNVEHVINNFVLPSNVTFTFEEQDPEQDGKEANNRLIRAQARAAMIASNEIDPLASRELAVQDGDLPEEMLAVLASRDEERQIEKQEHAEVDMQRQQALSMAQQRPAFNTEHKALAGVDALVDPAIELVVAGLKDDEHWPDSDAAAGSYIGVFLQTRIHRAFSMAADDLAGLGYMDTEGRILLSSVIGDALRYFVERLDVDAPHEAYTWVPRDHLEGLLKSIGSFGAEARLSEKSKHPPSRTKLEELAADKLEDELDEIYRMTMVRIEQLRAEDGDKSYALSEPKGKKKPKKVREKVTVTRDPTGRIGGFVKDTTEE